MRTRGVQAVREISAISQVPYVSGQYHRSHEGLVPVTWVAYLSLSLVSLVDGQ